MPDEKNVVELLRRYREAALRAGDLSDPKEQNRSADEVHSCYKELRQCAAGREGIIGLMADDDLSVRTWAAGHSLQWVPERAQVILEELRDRKVFPHSLNAKMTLEEFRSGELFDI